MATLAAEMVSSDLQTGTDPGAGGRRCPGCGGPMGTRRVNTDPPGGADVATCDTCHLVWLDSDVRAVLPLRLSADRAAALADAASSVDATVVLAPERCPSCGAPWQVVDGVRCRWCGASLVTMVPTPDA